MSGGWNTSPVNHVGLFAAGAETAAPAQLLSAMQRALQVPPTATHTPPHARTHASLFSMARPTPAHVGSLQPLLQRRAAT